MELCPADVLETLGPVCVFFLVPVLPVPALLEEPVLDVLLLEEPLLKSLIIFHLSILILFRSCYSIAQIFEKKITYFLNFFFR